MKKNRNYGNPTSSSIRLPKRFSKETDYEIKLVLQLLNPLDLNKLLLFIPPDNLKYIYKKITPSEFQSILDSASKKDNGYMLNKIKIKTILYNDTKKGS